MKPTYFSLKRATVYFIRPIGMQGPIKIGCSIAPDGRRSSLETWSPFPLEIVAEIEGIRLLERRFHALFREQHRSREWFAWSPELQRVMDEVAAGTFDVDTLPDPQGLRPRNRKVKWSEASRRRASLNSRVRNTSRKHNRYLPRGIDSYRAHDDPAKVAAMEAFVADPFANGISRAELAAS
jgi:hypothetical protein